MGEERGEERGERARERERDCRSVREERARAVHVRVRDNDREERGGERR